MVNRVQSKLVFPLHSDMRWCNCLRPTRSHRRSAVRLNRRREQRNSTVRSPRGRSSMMLLTSSSTSHARCIMQALGLRSNITGRTCGRDDVRNDGCGAEGKEGAKAYSEVRHKTIQDHVTAWKKRWLVVHGTGGCSSSGNLILGHVRPRASITAQGVASPAFNSFLPKFDSSEILINRPTGLKAIELHHTIVPSLPVPLPAPCSARTSSTHHSHTTRRLLPPWRRALAVRKNMRGRRG